jgi:hypothetical protein
MALETGKKQVAGKTSLSILLPLRFVEICSRLTFLFLDLRSALGTSTTQTEVLQAAYNSSQREMEALQEAALEACQSVDEGAGQVGRSMVSHLWALGGHVTQRMRGALRLGIEKTLSVVQSHYWFDIAALATCTGYVVTDDLDDDDAEAEANRLDALAAHATDILADDFVEILFPDAPPTGPLEP